MAQRKARAINPRSERSAAAARERRYDAIRARGRQANPVMLCYDAASGTLQGQDSPLDGHPVELAGLNKESAMVLVRDGALPGGELIVPLCADAPRSVRATQASQCCIDEVSGVISCPGGALDGRTIPAAVRSCYVADDGTRTCVITTGDERFELPVCAQPEPQPQPEPIPPDVTGCCIDEDTGEIVCPGGEQQWYMHGRVIPEVARGCYDADDGSRRCTIPTGDAELDLPVCPKPPQSCCYDAAAGRLRCDRPGGFDGMEVSLVSMSPQQDGSIRAVVQSDELTPRIQEFPVCDDRVMDCCYDSTTEKLVCSDAALDGAPAGLLASWVGEDGQIYVWAAWRGGAARMPLCPGIEECPPVFCCVNLQTRKYVCPGRPEVNGQEASIVEIKTENGFTFGILDDGTQIPMCGQECPPPQLCPECPTCPPGQWFSPDGTCHPPPKCPPGEDPCPPGMWRDPNGACVEPPKCPSCPMCPGCPNAHEHPCNECGRDPCAHRPIAGGRRARIAGNPRTAGYGAQYLRVPTTSYRNPRKRRILQGN